MPFLGPSDEPRRQRSAPASSASALASVAIVPPKRQESDMPVSNLFEEKSGDSHWGQVRNKLPLFNARVVQAQPSAGARSTHREFDFKSVAFFLPEGIARQAESFTGSKSARPLPTSSAFMAQSFRFMLWLLTQPHPTRSLSCSQGMHITVWHSVRDRQAASGGKRQRQGPAQVSFNSSCVLHACQCAEA